MLVKWNCLNKVFQILDCFCRRAEFKGAVKQIHSLILTFWKQNFTNSAILKNRLIYAGVCFVGACSNFAQTVGSLDFRIAEFSLHSLSGICTK